ncbi:MAG: chromosomal replication initiator protein DnaA [Bifidobacteriaceae bacterium]|nr:chromosomal replication initiator protein DnaA [Bifidobacteriaceae bacterium]
MTGPQNIEQIWRHVLDSLTASGRITGSDFGFAALVTPVGLVGDTVLLAVASEYTKDHIEHYLREPLTEALSLAAEQPVTFAITVDPQLADIVLTDLPPREPAPQVTPEPPRPPHPQAASHLQARYTFETFVVGTSNRFAATAARAVAESPAKAYNPLYIFGGSGLGKTHLIHAIGNYALALSPQLRVLYTTSEDFANDFIYFLGLRKMEDFKRRYRSNDILLIDDIQFLIGKGQITEEFFHTFNSLYNSGSHIVITSDTPPKQLSGFQDRLRSRLEWGLLTDVLPPELETRIAILRQKAVSEGLDAPAEVQHYIASRVSSNVRELEGALIRVTAFANLNHQPVDLALAEVVLRDLVTDSQAVITPALIIGQTAKYFTLTVEDICGPSRRRNLIDARHIAMYLCRELTDLSLPAIAREFGGRDHTTIMSACRKVAETLSEKSALFNKVSALTYQIKQAAAQQ